MSAINSEMIYICRNHPALAAELELDMNARWNQSLVLLSASGDEVQYDNLFKGADASVLWKFWLVMPFSYLFDFLL